MGPKERSWLKHYKVIDGDLIYEFDACLLICLDDSHLLMIAKYEVNGREITHTISRVFCHQQEVKTIYDLAAK